LVKTKTTYHHGDLRVALIEAALEIIEEIGPQGLTIRKVAQRAGVSHAAPYRHFAGKDALILAVVERGFELLAEAMDRARAAAGEDRLAQFAAVGDAYVEFGMAYPAYYKVMYSGDLLSVSDNPDLQQASAAAFDRMTDDIRAGQALGIVKQGDPKLLAIAIVSSVHGFLSLANDNRLERLHGKGANLAELKDFVMQCIFEGVGVPQS
jgi:AcrR family transcriptional regulator